MFVPPYFFSVPSVTIHGAAENFNVGENYTLTCTVSSSSSSTHEFQWRQNNVPWNVTGPVLSFSPLRLHHAGQYSCSITAAYNDYIEITLHSKEH